MTQTTLNANGRQFGKTTEFNKHCGAACPKCGSNSGNDWSQCRNDCPMPMSTKKMDFGQIVKEFDDLGYTLSFEGYIDEIGCGNKAVAIHRGTKKRRTLMDRYYARDCITASHKLLQKIQREIVSNVRI